VKDVDAGATRPAAVTGTADPAVPQAFTAALPAAPGTQDPVPTAFAADLLAAISAVSVWRSRLTR
jgi:hypothetical protein